MTEMSIVKEIRGYRKWVLAAGMIVFAITAAGCSVLEDIGHFFVGNNDAKVIEATPVPPPTAISGKQVRETEVEYRRRYQQMTCTTVAPGNRACSSSPDDFPGDYANTLFETSNAAYATQNAPGNP